MSSYRYGSRSYDPYYGDYYPQYYNSSYRKPSGYYTSRDGRWPATSRHYELPTKSTVARHGVYDHRGWNSDSDYAYWRRPIRSARQANVWDVMNHHRDYYRDPSPRRGTNNGGVYYDYHGRAHRRLESNDGPVNVTRNQLKTYDSRLPPISRY